MITRLYIDNYKCFTNFEYVPGQNQLLLGLNGTGKSSLFDVLHLLRSLVMEGRALDELLDCGTLTRWQTLDVQSFGADVSGNEGKYEYTLKVDHDRDKRICRILDEKLRFQQPSGMAPGTLFERHLGEGRLYRDDFSEGPEVVMDWSRSGLFSIQPRHDNTRLTWFKERLARVMCLRVEPRSMITISEQERASPDSSLKEFASWYRHLSQEYPSIQGPLFDRLRDVLGEEFDSLKLEKEGGDARALSAGFRPSGAETAWYRFSELSDGQRTLVVLYTLSAFLRKVGGDVKKGVTLCLDEPDNYIALTELQPWIREIRDILDQTSGQALIISHHPEFINYYAPSDAVWLDRPGGAHVRLSPLEYSGGDPLTPAELVARGWVANER